MSLPLNESGLEKQHSRQEKEVCKGKKLEMCVTCLDKNEAASLLGVLHTEVRDDGVRKVETTNKRLRG